MNLNTNASTKEVKRKVKKYSQVDCGSKLHTYIHSFSIKLSWVYFSWYEQCI